ncbi:MAG TPA: type II toxin-antitoxin system RelE/ParE family toxin [Lacipirellulaceae bacterium]|nr:type II toxin-antitoxin system RelE/ParE family toxin [Lacipirellulaceae bacterium]
MAECDVRFIDNAAGEVKRLDPAIRRRVAKRLGWLRANLDSIIPESLTGRLVGLYKLRVGDYRVIYEIVRDERVIIIQAVGHRRDIYRKQ